MYEVTIGQGNHCPICVTALPGCQGILWFRDEPNVWLRVQGMLGRIGPSVNSGASMSVVEIQGFQWGSQQVIDC